MGWYCSCCTAWSISRKCSHLKVGRHRWSEMKSHCENTELYAKVFNIIPQGLFCRKWWNYLWPKIYIEYLGPQQKGILDSQNRMFVVFPQTSAMKKSQCFLKHLYCQLTSVFTCSRWFSIHSFIHPSHHPSFYSYNYTFFNQLNLVSYNFTHNPV